jgi:23S rRNA pseudouridine1911/1915/1917 synthase
MTAPPRTLIADRGDAGRRLDLVVRRHLADVEAATRTRIQAWIAGGLVSVNGRAVARVACRVALGDRVAIAVPPEDRRPPPAEIRPEPAPLEVLFEDEQLIAVNKPPGVVVHPTYRHASGTILNALLWRARQWPAGQRPSIVGRLDKFTTGIVIAAKTAPIHAALQRILASTRSEKEYLALVYGRVAPASGAIDLRLRRDPHDRRRVVASARLGSASVTHYERLDRAPARPVGLSLLRCRLQTGRMHQIRVHLAARGWPLVGDPKYGEPRWQRVSDLPLRAALRSFPRQALHAWRLTMAHPSTARALTVEAPLPADLKALLDAAGLVECAR